MPKKLRKFVKSRARPLRSQLWFDNPENPGMTALYLERYLNYGLTSKELRSGKPIIGIAQTGSDLSPCNRHTWNSLGACVRASGRRAASLLNSRAIRSRKPANDRRPRLIVILPI